MEIRGPEHNEPKIRFKKLKYSSSVFLKTLLLVLGLCSLSVLVLLNAWQSISEPTIVYSKREIYISEDLHYSDLLNYAADYNGCKVLDHHPNDHSLIEKILGTTRNSPEKSLSDNNSKGNCWGFKGSSGYLVLSLEKPIYPLHFSVKHINLAEFSSAPQDFCVYRFPENSTLGCYKFDISKKNPSPQFFQTFECLNDCGKPAKEFKVEINSNHGASHTCLYQVLIHGDPKDFIY